jgi:hypothetical protein
MPSLVACAITRWQAAAFAEPGNEGKRVVQLFQNGWEHSTQADVDIPLMLAD